MAGLASDGPFLLEAPMTQLNKDEWPADREESGIEQQHTYADEMIGGGVLADDEDDCVVNNIEPDECVD
jgi:hypothetical protein